MNEECSNEEERRIKGPQPTAASVPSLFDLPLACPSLDTTASAPPAATTPEARAAAKSWPSIPGFEIHCELGRGGMGVVYKAWQPGLQRMVALKIVAGSNAANERERERFQGEALAIARLQHANIVQLFDAGMHDGQPYLYMEFVNGTSLDRVLNAAPQAISEAVRMVQVLAQAMHAAHERNLVHRDLKPANILMDSAGTLKIADFGLAKRLDEESGQTRAGAILGTPSYMAPEQAEGRLEEISPATDVYALGAILYEMLTGRPPFHGSNVSETIELVRSAHPVTPRSLRPLIPRDLEAICLACLQKEPRHRYPTAMALADDLKRFSNGEAITLHEPSLLDRLSRTLSKTRLQGQFGGWSNLLLVMAGVVLGSHLILHYLYVTRRPFSWIVAADCLQFGFLGLAIWLHRRQRRMPVVIDEHRLWLLAIGFFMACALVRFIVSWQDRSGNAVYEMRVYPLWCVLAGLVMFTIGATYWGWAYLFSGVFALLAIWLLGAPTYGAIGFGLVWSLFLLSLGVHVRYLSDGKDAAESEPGVKP